MSTPTPDLGAKMTELVNKTRADIEAGKKPDASAMLGMLQGVMGPVLAEMAASEENWNNLKHTMLALGTRITNIETALKTILERLPKK